mmetsp:Transcript_58672/g.67605  ORF Transcript_58672/g.67605 Transcript_58672/m.67605 type:complete len:89 (+) Transcript_58672:96-362(+)
MVRSKTVEYAKSNPTEVVKSYAQSEHPKRELALKAMGVKNPRCRSALITAWPPKGDKKKETTNKSDGTSNNSQRIGNGQKKSKDGLVN